MDKSVSVVEEIITSLTRNKWTSDVEMNMIKSSIRNGKSVGADLLWLFGTIHNDGFL